MRRSCYSKCKDDIINQTQPKYSGAACLAGQLWNGVTNIIARQPDGLQWNIVDN